eukprot:RCo042290
MYWFSAMLTFGISGRTKRRVARILLDSDVSWQHLAGVANGIEDTLKILEAQTKSGAMKNSHFEETKYQRNQLIQLPQSVVVHKPDGNVRQALQFASKRPGQAYYPEDYSQSS